MSIGKCVNSDFGMGIPRVGFWVAGHIVDKVYDPMDCEFVIFTCHGRHLYKKKTLNKKIAD